MTKKKYKKDDTIKMLQATYKQNDSLHAQHKMERAFHILFEELVKKKRKTK